MYTLTHIKGPPIHLQLPGREVHMPAKGDTAVISDEEYESGPVKGRLKYKTIKAEYSDGEFETPQTERLRQPEARKLAASRNKRRAAGAIL